jgi:hypothetical protein
MNTGPTNAFFGGDFGRIFANRKLQRAKEIMLYPLHVTEEIGKMNDASHIGIGKLNALGKSVAVRHGE